MTASNSLWLVTTTAPSARKVRITPRHPFFFTSDETYTPDVTAKATDATGVAGLANVPTGIPTVNVIHAASGYKLYDFKMTANPATFVLVFIYARDLRL